MPYFFVMDATTEQAALSVSLLALPETTPAAIYGFIEVFSAVNVTWPQLTGEPTDGPRMIPCMVARSAGTYMTVAGVPLAPSLSLEDAGESDIVIVSDLQLSPDLDPRGRWPEESDWVGRQFSGGATVCSVCTGSVFLAEAGLLDGEEATTHWGATGIFEQYYPAVKLKAERILCHAGPERRIVTGGGSAAWADLALYLVARFCGAAEAVRTSKIFVIGDHTDGQLPFAAMNRHRYHEDAIIEQCQVWIARHYAEPNPVSRMVKHAQLPERTFKRRFKAATGYAPVEYVQALRIEEAKQWLESTSEATETIANKVGYEDPAYFRKLFKRKTGVTPSRYRQRFRAIGKVR
jgi:transcriptional regulator GlxA family with amidase domain